ncbi:hypothetical protein ACFL1V_10940 [Pseudomonadota bacterium]
MLRLTEVVQILEHQVQGSDGIANGSRYLAGAQAFIAVLHHHLFSGRQGHVPKFIAAMIAASCHCLNLLFKPTGQVKQGRVEK